LADMPALHCSSTACVHCVQSSERGYTCANMCCSRQTPVLQPFPDLTDAATAFPQYTLPGINPRRGTRLENIYMQACACSLHSCAAGSQSAPCMLAHGSR